MTRTRVLAALIMAPLAIAAVLFLKTPLLALLCAVLFLAGLWEWLKLAEVEDTLARSVLLLCNLLLMVALVWGSRTPQGGTLVLLDVVVLLGVAWWLLSILWLRHYHFASNHGSHARMAKLLAGTLAVVPAWCALGVIHASDPQPGPIAGIPQGHWWLLTSLATVWAADTGAYFSGKYLGRHKMSPRISPNKTVEGLVGGVVAGMATAMAFSTLAGARGDVYAKVALVALATVLFSVVGDLFESLLKRHVGAKDSGDLIPGHGGVLDRIDSQLAALPVFALGKAWLGF